MGQDDQEGTDNVGTEGDSVLLKDLRRQLREKDAEINKYKSRDEAFNRVRESSAENLLMEAGYPKLKEDVLEKVEGIPSKEDISAFLEARGLEARQLDATDASPEDEEDDQAPDVGDVAGLGQQVAAAARRTVTTDLDKKLETAKTVEELDAVMAEAGLRG